MSSLTAWADFYLIIGTAAATLTGLMFVVITLVAGTARRSSTGLGIYSTPTVVHFAATLLITVLLSAPWPELRQASIPLGLLGLTGLAYGAVVLRRAVSAARSETYQLVLEDWLCHTILPLVGYAALLVAAFVLPSHTVPALFAVGAVSVLFIVLGIHNAWDIVTFITMIQLPAETAPREQQTGTPPQSPLTPAEQNAPHPTDNGDGAPAPVTGRR